MTNTIANYTGNGTQTDFVVPFDYLKKSFVHVYVDNGLTILTGGDYGDTGADYYFLDDTTIRLKTAPAEGEGIVVRRYTSATERIVSFEDASILKATDLDTSQLQAFHIAEEARDNVKEAMLRGDEGNWDAQNARIVNVADPVDDQDAMTLGYYKNDKQSVIDLKNETKGYRDEALGFRNEAKEFKDTAEGYKDDAEESKNLAKDWAIKMDGKVVEEGEEIDYSAKYWAQSVAEVGEAAKVVADNIEDVNSVADNIDDVNTVAGDLEGSFKPPQFTDMGRVGTGETEEIGVTGGNIKTVADNIEDVNSVADAIQDGSLQMAIDSVPVTVENVRLSNEAKDGAVAASNKAKDWAIKMDGKVTDDEGLEVDYSSKYYADQAKASAEEANVSADVATEAVTEGVSEINALSQQKVTEITNAGTTQVNNVNTAGTTQVKAVNTAGSTQVDKVNTAGTTQVKAVNTAGSTQVKAVNTAGSTQVSAVTAEGTKQTGIVTAKGTEQIALVGQKGDSVVAIIDSSKDGLIEELQTEGETQIGLIETAGSTQVGKVNTAGTTQVKAVNTAGSTQVDKVNTAGTTQVKAVNTAGTAQIAAIGTATEEAIADLEPYVEKAQAWAEKTDGHVEGGSYSAKYWANQALSAQFRADWNETDSSNKGYIKNKPDLSVYAKKTYVDSALSSALVYKGSVNTYANLPVASQKVGDMYNVARADSSHGIKAGDNVAWNGSAWDVLAGAVDLSAYLTKSSASSTYATIDDLEATNNSLDTLKTTVGTKANDSAVVKLTGNQTIAGTKTFSETIVGSINGNAATADKLKTARTINGTSFNGSANININNIVSRGQVTALSGSTRGSIKGIQLYEAYNNGYPYQYGNVIHMRGSRDDYGGDNEIMFTWNDSDRVFIRSLRNSATSEWTKWSELQVVRTDYGRVGS